ncbi:MAG: arylsulfatase [Cycloclasticus sp.]|nr:arylsulfatase [Cycloclasticus sp.]MBG96037.1 arylsulfatase [Cycloclasticus sp.]HAI97541.1 TIGR04211 family SH3 domain-containing protein [Methylococcaceae bacterium]|tara:strand:- start:639 stop:1271 length:633 start_codon:yes stop_codon:yes gene_type:complete
MLKRFLFLLLFLPVTVNAAHITDKLLAGMYVKPNNTQQPIELLPSGTPIELIGEARGFVKVQLVDGKTGWVEKRFISEQKPAKVRLLSLQSKYRQLQEKLDRAEAALAGLKQPAKTVAAEEKEKAEAKLQAERAKAREETWQLQQQIKPSTAVEVSTQKVSKKGAKDSDGLIWLVFLFALLVVALVSVYVGMKIQETRYLKRHGGFRLWR